LKTKFAVSYSATAVPFYFDGQTPWKNPEKLAELHASCNFLPRPDSFLTATRRATRYKISVHPPFIRYAACTRRGIFNDFAQENCSYRHPEYGFHLRRIRRFLQMPFTTLLDLVRLRFVDFYTRRSSTSRLCIRFYE